MSGERKIFKGEEIGRPAGRYIQLTCEVCEKTRYVQFKAPPYARKCADCHKSYYGGTLGSLGPPNRDSSPR
jgi:ribosomal protein S27E